MKRPLKIFCALLIPLIAALVLYDYYLTLPIEGSYETEPVAHVQVDKPALKKRLELLETSELEKMRVAGLEVYKWQNMLTKVGSNVIAEVVPDSDPFFVREHYPYDEVFDQESQSLYYYHSHRPNEHGHFHLFYCDPDVLSNYEPLQTWGKKNSSVHLLAISIHPDGTPLGFFTTNQWITPKEWWYKGQDIAELVDHFEISHSYPSWPANQWISHMLKLFKPQIEDLLIQRDQKLADCGKPLEKALKDRSMDLLSQVDISIELQLEVIDEILSLRSALEQKEEQLIEE